MAREIDFYQVLGVERGASQKEIRQAYRKLARKHHPDVNPGDSAAEQRFKEISQAYEVLSDTEKRKDYDRFGQAYQQARGQSGGAPDDFANFVYTHYGAGSFADIFGDLFGNMYTDGGRTRTAAPQSTPQRGPDIEHEMGITLKEAYTGIEKTLNLSIADRCPDCDGVGGMTATCSNCGGSGRMSSGGLFGMGATCPNCQGSGQVITGSCSRCGGGGEVARERKIKVQIPAGVNTGSRVRIAGEGGRGVRGGTNGDLFLVMNVADHPYFKRDGDDIHVEVPISFVEASLGARISVPTVAGRVAMNISAGTRNGQRLRLKGQGFPKLKGRGKGDQYVTVSVSVPKKLNAKQREAVEALGKVLHDDPRADLPPGL
jgi:molecular chaperone DnaJ